MPLKTDEQLEKDSRPRTWRDLSDEERKMIVAKLVHIINKHEPVLISVIAILNAGSMFGLLEDFVPLKELSEIY